MERLLNKVSHDEGSVVRTDIANGGADEIQWGEIVLGLRKGDERIYWRNSLDELVWVQAFGYLESVEGDSSPALGGNLAMRGYNLYSESGPIRLMPGDGLLEVQGNTITFGDLTTRYPGGIRFLDPTRSLSVTLRVPDTSSFDQAATTLYLPTSPGLSGQVIASNGAGQLYWATVAGVGEMVRELDDLSDADFSATPGDGSIVTLSSSFEQGSGYTRGTYAEVVLAGGTPTIIEGTDDYRIIALAATNGDGVADGTYAVTLDGGTPSPVVGTNTYEILALDAIVPGSGYTPGTYPDVPLDGGQPTVQAVATINIQITNAITALDPIVSGGSGYADANYLGETLTGGSPTVAATVDIVVAGGTVTTVTLKTAGKGYQAGDALSADLDGVGTGFQVTVATVDTDGRVDSVTFISDADRGEGYAPGDVLTVSSVLLGGSGAGFSVNVLEVEEGTPNRASVSFTVSGGAIVGDVSITNAGAGYQVGDVLTPASADLGSPVEVPTFEVTEVYEGTPDRARATVQIEPAINNQLRSARYAIDETGFGEWVLGPDELSSATSLSITADDQITFYLTDTQGQQFYIGTENAIGYASAVTDTAIVENNGATDGQVILKGGTTGTYYILLPDRLPTASVYVSGPAPGVVVACLLSYAGRGYASGDTLSLTAGTGTPALPVAGTGFTVDVQTVNTGTAGELKVYSLETLVTNGVGGGYLRYGVASKGDLGQVGLESRNRQNTFLLTDDSSAGRWTGSYWDPEAYATTGLLVRLDKAGMGQLSGEVRIAPGGALWYAQDPPTKVWKEDFRTSQSNYASPSHLMDWDQLIPSFGMIKTWAATSLADVVQFTLNQLWDVDVAGAGWSSWDAEGNYKGWPSLQYNAGLQTWVDRFINTWDLADIDAANILLPEDEDNSESSQKAVKIRARSLAIQNNPYGIDKDLCIHSFPNDHQLLIGSALRTTRSDVRLYRPITYRRSDALPTLLQQSGELQLPSFGQVIDYLNTGTTTGQIPMWDQVTKQWLPAFVNTADGVLFAQLKRLSDISYLSTNNGMYAIDGQVLRGRGNASSGPYLDFGNSLQDELTLNDGLRVGSLQSTFTKKAYYSNTGAQPAITDNLGIPSMGLVKTWTGVGTQPGQVPVWDSGNGRWTAGTAGDISGMQTRIDAGIENYFIRNPIDTGGGTGDGTGGATSLDELTDVVANQDSYSVALIGYNKLFLNATSNQAYLLQPSPTSIGFYIDDNKQLTLGNAGIVVGSSTPLIYNGEEGAQIEINDYRVPSGHTIRTFINLYFGDPETDPTRSFTGLNDVTTSTKGQFWFDDVRKFGSQYVNTTQGSSPSYGFIEFGDTGLILSGARYTPADQSATGYNLFLDAVAGYCALQTAPGNQVRLDGTSFRWESSNSSRYTSLLTTDNQFTCWGNVKAYLEPGGASGEIPIWNSLLQMWEAGAISEVAGATKLDELSDTTFSVTGGLEVDGLSYFKPSGAANTARVAFSAGQVQLLSVSSASRPSYVTISQTSIRLGGLITSPTDTAHGQRVVEVNDLWQLRYIKPASWTNWYGDTPYTGPDLIDDLSIPCFSQIKTWVLDEAPLGATNLNDLADANYASGQLAIAGLTKLTAQEATGSLLFSATSAGLASPDGLAVFAVEDSKASINKPIYSTASTPLEAYVNPLNPAEGTVANSEIIPRWGEIKAWGDDKWGGAPLSRDIDWEVASTVGQLPAPGDVPGMVAYVKGAGGIYFAQPDVYDATGTYVETAAQWVKVLTAEPPGTAVYGYADPLKQVAYGGLLGDLLDVNTPRVPNGDTAPAMGSVLAWTGAQWEPQLGVAPDLSNATIDELKDVAVTTSRTGLAIEVSITEYRYGAADGPWRYAVNGVQEAPFPTITLGDRVEITVDTPNNPVWIKATNVTGTGSTLSQVDNNGATSGLIKYTPPEPGYYYIVSQNNSSAGLTIIVNPVTQIVDDGHTLVYDSTAQEFQNVALGLNSLGDGYTTQEVYRWAIDILASSTYTINAWTTNKPIYGVGGGLIGNQAVNVLRTAVPLQTSGGMSLRSANNLGEIGWHWSQAGAPALRYTTGGSNDFDEWGYLNPERSNETSVAVLDGYVEVFGSTDIVAGAWGGIRYNRPPEVPASGADRDNTILCRSQVVALIGTTGSSLFIPSTDKGAANGVATLDETGKVPAAQLNIDMNGLDITPPDCVGDATAVLAYDCATAEWKAKKVTAIRGGTF